MVGTLEEHVTSTYGPVMMRESAVAIADVDSLMDEDDISKLIPLS